MLSLVRFRRAVEIAACRSNFSSAGRKHVADFYMFYIGAEIASGNHVAQPVTSQHRLVERSTGRRSNKMAHSSIRMSLLIFRLTLLRKFQTLRQQQGETVYPVVTLLSHNQGLQTSCGLDFSFTQVLV